MHHIQRHIKVQIIPFIIDLTFCLWIHNFFTDLIAKLVLKIHVSTCKFYCLIKYKYISIMASVWEAGHYHGTTLFPDLDWTEHTRINMYAGVCNSRRAVEKPRRHLASEIWQLKYKKKVIYEIWYMTFDIWHRTPDI